MNTQQGCTSAIIQNDKEEILFTKRSDNDDFLPGMWELPGGGMEYGESAEDCIVREIKEECGIEIEVVKPVAVGNYYIDEVQRIEICFLCRPKSLEVKLSDEHSDFKWLKIDQINQIKVSEYIEKILNSAKPNI